MTPALKAEGPMVRNAVPSDISEITRIYAHHVLNGLASFEETPPDAGEMTRRFDAIHEKSLPYLIAEIDGHICGYAYAMLYRERSAYRYTVENSIYIDPEWQRRGVASALLHRLIDACAATGARQMIAVIGDSANAASIGLHARHGFRAAGTLPSVGYKFGRWVDSVIMVRPLGDGDLTQP